MSVAWVGVGVAAAGALSSSSASKKAAKAQGQAADKADATQRYQYDTTRADNAPFRDSGVAANNRLSYLLGLQGSNGPDLTPEQMRAELVGQYTTQGAPIQRKKKRGFFSKIDPIGSSILGALSGGGGGGYGPSTINEAGLSSAIQARIAKQEEDIAARENDPNYGSLSRNFGESDLNSDPVLNAADGYMAPMHDFNQSDLAGDMVYQNGLQFGLDEGRKGIENQASASGNMLSGATLKALTRFGNDYGSTKTEGAYNRFYSNQNNKYGQRADSFNRFNTNQDRTYNKLAGVSGAGQQATNQVSAAGQNMANNISASQIGAGNAKASGIVGSANAWNSAIGQGVNAWQQNNMLNRIYPQQQPTQQQTMLNAQWTN